MSDLLTSLNQEQCQAVSSPCGNYLVLAGAGSGKTRVLVHRIAWLMQTEQISPFAIMAVTFTNKAAAEMRQRIEKLLPISTRGMWMGTFHSLAHRFLRAHWQEANLPEAFQILDSDDQYRLIKRLLKSLELDENQWSPREIQWFINHKKDAGIRHNKIHAGDDLHLKTQQKVYQAYEESCQRAGLVDFAELLLRAYEVLRDTPSLLAHYQQRFSQILVDEFQDTNTIQYAWLKLLAGDNSHIMAVGDDDQAIYGWRGANIKNIHKFTQDFPQTQMIRLEQNYRSTATILDAANSLIAHNAGRLGKQLWTQGEQGELIDIYAAFNDLDEARYISESIQQQLETGVVADEVAVLYRSNAQSRVLEEALIQAQIPYRIYGGLRFFERAEIKDAMAYLRLIMGRQDDAAFERIVNFPTRGIGEKTLGLLRFEARQNNKSLWQASLDILQEKQLTARAHNALQAFIDLINQMSEGKEELALQELAQAVIQGSGLWAHYSKSRQDKNIARLENLEELVTACKHYDGDPDASSDMPLLAQFISHAALEAGEAQAADDQVCVQLMTLHSAKGLEFPIVFMAGIEEGLFPHRMSYDEGRLEEERRLCYVGMTRAMRKLTLSYAEIRRTYGREEYHRPSRFLQELPAKYLQAVKITKSSGQAHVASSNFSQQPLGDSGLQLGQSVRHPKFGEGLVINYEGQGAHARVQVAFPSHGNKWLVLAYANLETCD